MSDDNDETTERSLMIFGRDVSKIPCFRNSFLYGISGGLAMGLGHFLFTSRPLASTNFAVYSFAGITLIYWAQCRYNYSKTKFEMMRIQELLRLNSLYEGTKEELDVNKNQNGDSKDGKVV